MPDHTHTSADTHSGDVITTAAVADALNRGAAATGYQLAPDGTPGYPCIQIAGLAVFVYAHGDGTFHIAAHFDPDPDRADDDGDGDGAGGGDGDGDGGGEAAGGDAIPLTIDLGTRPYLLRADRFGREWVYGQQRCARCRGPITDPHNVPDGAGALCRACSDLDEDPTRAAALDLDLTQPAVRAILGLYRDLKTVEGRDGSWGGADTVAALCSWFTGLGIDPDHDLAVMLARTHTGATRRGLGPDGPDNTDRARWAAAALDAFGAATGQTGYTYTDPDHLSEIGGDLQADLMHLCDRAGLDPDMLIDRGRRHYDDEHDDDEHDADEHDDDAATTTATTADAVTRGEADGSWEPVDYYPVPGAIVIDDDDGIDPDGIDPDQARGPGGAGRAS